MPLATDASNFDACYHRVYGHQLLINRTRQAKHHCTMLSPLSLLLALLLAVSALAESMMSTGQSSTLFKFTLAAHNTTLPNANATGVPLVLGQNGMRVVRTSSFLINVHRCDHWHELPSHIRMSTFLEP